MKIAAPSRINRKIKMVSRKLGVKEDEVIKNALSFYLDNLTPYLELRDELKQWETVSDEALANFEQTL
jgi:hypothetical protein